MARSPRGTGFIDFGRYLSANRPSAEKMVEKIANPIEEAGQGLMTDLEAAKARAAEGGTLLEGAGDLARRATEVGGKARALGDFGGLAAAVQDLGPRTSAYGLGMNMLDAGLTGAAGGERFQGLKDRYGGLFGKVSEAAKGAQEATQKPKVVKPVIEPEPVMPEERRPGRPLYKRDQLDFRKRDYSYDFS